MSEPTPPKWYDSPTLKYLGGIVLSVVLGILASRWGITPAPLPPMPSQTPTVLVLNVGTHPAEPIAVGK